MKYVFIYFKEQLDNLSTIVYISKFTAKNNYMGLKLGKIWSYLEPLTLFLVFYLLFGVLFPRSIPGTVPAVPWILIGIAIWFFLQFTVVNGSTSIAYQYSYFSMMKFPMSILPTVQMFYNLSVLGAMGGATIIIAMYDGYFPNLYWIQLIYYAIALIALVLSYTLLCSTIVVFFRDFKMFLTYASRFMMYFSGVVFDMTTFHIIPGAIRQAMLLNPVYYVVEGFRDAIFARQWVWQKDWSYTCVFWGLIFILFVVASYLHIKYRDKFSDYVN